MSKVSYDGYELEHFDSAYNFRKYQIQLIKKYLQKNLAEVGPGRGGLVEYYKKFVKKICLLEADKSLYQFLKKKIKNKKIKIKNIKITNINKKFETIIYFDVLEHIKNDLREVKEAKKKLNKKGFLIFSVPAHQYFYNNFDKSVGHLKRYNKNDFKKIENKTGLKIEKLVYYDSIGFLLLILNKIFSLSQKNLNYKIQFWNLLIPISKIIDFVTFNNFGKSLLCVFRNDKK
jgi:2-polyprenyl-3-methyl-5-hydroxy-6-metoxy-1,4-benzoquinol methylase